MSITRTNFSRSGWVLSSAGDAGEDEIATRAITAADRNARLPALVVWETTLACDQQCIHCGSKAGRPRPNELTTEESLDVIRRLSRMGTREIDLMGGETYLRRDWLEIITTIREHEMVCALQTGGRGMTSERLRSAAHAGLQYLGVSIDGLAEVHNFLRGLPDSFEKALSTLREATAHGLETGVTTQLTSLVIPRLRELLGLIADAGAAVWQVQVTSPIGRAADQPALMLQPHQVLELMPLLADLFEEGLERGLLLKPADCIGYFGPYEALFRGMEDDNIYWRGCHAGRNAMGIESDGTIKGCLSLRGTSAAAGNVRETDLEAIWVAAPELQVISGMTVEDLWGFCRTCYYAAVCRAGCNSIAYGLLGCPGNNPYCHHRTLELERRGLRERIDGLSHSGHYRLELEQMPGATPRSPRTYPDRPSADSELEICWGCQRHVTRGTQSCPHCGGDVPTLAADYKARRSNLFKAHDLFLKRFQELRDAAGGELDDLLSDTICIPTPQL